MDLAFLFIFSTNASSEPDASSAKARQHSAPEGSITP
jgi:hypothetical protein